MVLPASFLENARAERGKVQLIPRNRLSGFRIDPLAIGKRNRGGTRLEVHKERERLLSIGPLPNDDTFRKGTGQLGHEIQIPGKETEQIVLEPQIIS
jgi:hypothetical protein